MAKEPAGRATMVKNNISSSTGPHRQPRKLVSETGHQFKELHLVLAWHEHHILLNQGHHHHRPHHQVLAPPLRHQLYVKLLH